MSLAQQSSQTRHDVALFQLIDQFAELEAQGQDKLTPGDVQAILQDVCIELRCGFGDLPKILQTIHADVMSRVVLEGHGAGSKFATKQLINSIERSL